MNLTNKRIEKMYKYDLDITDEEKTQLAKIGLNRIKTDQNALIDYAIIKILEDYVLKMEGIQNGNNNNSKRQALDYTR